MCVFQRKTGDRPISKTVIDRA